MSNQMEMIEKALLRFSRSLIDQNRARVIIEAEDQRSGYWFGGGNLVISPDKSSLYVIGRYRDGGDSRTGISAGERGKELAIFCSPLSFPFPAAFSKVASFDKHAFGENVLSIEGSALRFNSKNEIELFVSIEKEISYPLEYKEYQKPGTGIWSIMYLKVSSIESLSMMTTSLPFITILESSNPEFLHMKDPNLYETTDGDLYVFYANHPFCWTTSNAGYAVRKKGEEQFEHIVNLFLHRGLCWDVAMTRITSVFDMPRVGLLENTPFNLSLAFYDGGECVHAHDNSQVPAGSSCEELGGLGYFNQYDFHNIIRLSKYSALFRSPFGTQSSRYVSVLTTSEGIAAIWEQSQPDFSHNLVYNFLSMEQVKELLS